MSGRDLGEKQHTADAEPEQDAPGSSLVQAKVDPEVRREIAGALAVFGFESTAAGVRLILKAFCRSAAVQEAVRDNLHLAVVDAPKTENPAA